MPRIAIGIEFNGSNYRGWQTQQDGVPSVQSTIEAALGKIANHPIVLHAAGRTDAGVHASNMIAHFDTTAVRTARNWIMGTNSLLSTDIALNWATQMPQDFHARFGAVARRYRYVIYNQSYRSAMLAGKATHVYYLLDVQKMQQAAQLLVGMHNFNSFRAVACQSNQPVRHVQHAQISQRGHLIVLDIQANGFLHHMVRNIIGVLLTIGRGEKPVEWITELIALEDRKAAAVTAPPDGLYFIQAYYPTQFNLPTIDLGPAWLGMGNQTSF